MTLWRIRWTFLALGLVMFGVEAYAFWAESSWLPDFNYEELVYVLLPALLISLSITLAWIRRPLRFVLTTALISAIIYGLGWYLLALLSFTSSPLTY